MSAVMQTAESEAVEAYLSGILTRMGEPLVGRYRTGTVAQILGVSRETVRQRIHCGRIQAIRDGGQHYVPYHELVNLIVRDSSPLR